LCKYFDIKFFLKSFFVKSRFRWQKSSVSPESKPATAAWDTAMERARKQAENYARRRPSEELVNGGRPPFLLAALGQAVEVNDGVWGKV
jgi:hypothetical protein